MFTKRSCKFERSETNLVIQIRRSVPVHFFFQEFFTFFLQMYVCFSSPLLFSIGSMYTSAIRVKKCKFNRVFQTKLQWDIFEGEKFRKFSNTLDIYIGNINILLEIYFCFTSKVHFESSMNEMILNNLFDIYFYPSLLIYSFYLVLHSVFWFFYHHSSCNMISLSSFQFHNSFCNIHKYNTFFFIIYIISFIMNIKITIKTQCLN